jgi:hypothetical protein
VLEPRGQYFTGDRELSPMRSALVGLSATWSAPTDDAGEVWGVLSSFQVTLKGDVLKTYFPEFHYDRAEVPNTLAQIVSIEVRAVF